MLKVLEKLNKILSGENLRSGNVDKFKLSIEIDYNFMLFKP